MTRLSIIVPIYNAENTLARCINSILSQSFSDFELILINDGSTDHSAEICASFTAIDPRVSYYNKKNGGVSSARNLGLRMAKGEYVTFVDADDYLLQTCYEHVNNSVSNADLVFFHFTYEQNGVRKKVFNKNLPELQNNPLNFMLLYEKSNGLMKDDKFVDNSISIFIWRLWCRTKFIREKNITFQENLRSGEDRIFLMNYLLFKPIIKICDDEFGYIHTVSNNGTNLTAIKDLRSYVPWMFMQQKNMDFAEQSICKKNPNLSLKDRKTIRLLRAEAMRNLVIINEFKNNKKKARANIDALFADEFFQWSFNFMNFVYSLKNSSLRNNIKFVLIKFRIYYLLEQIYKSTS